mmetsp:Transcript_62742/g.101632  ORF Transcript_62742/g.101632 Transcript_62742/m.101632 type:complete len:253 (-) Transcript_62742:122-880(-)
MNLFLGGPAEDVQEQDAPECQGEHGSILLLGNLDHDRHQADHETVRDVGQWGEHLREVSGCLDVLRPGIRGDAAQDWPDAQETLEDALLHHRQGEVNAGNDLGCSHQDYDAGEGGIGRPGLQQSVPEDVVDHGQHKLVDANTHGHSRKGVVGLPVDSSLAHKLHVTKFGHLHAAVFAQLVDVVPAPLQTPRVCSQRSVVSSNLLGVAARVPGSHGARGRSSPCSRVSCSVVLLLSRREGHAEHLPRIHLLEL